MKTTILIALGLAAVPAVVTTLVNSPQIVPQSVWNKLPLPASNLSDADVADMNQKYGYAESNSKKLLRVTDEALAHSASPVIRVDAGARNPVMGARPAGPTLLAQTDDPGGDADPSQPTQPTPATPETSEAPLEPVTRKIQAAVNEIQREAERAQQEAQKAAAEAKVAFDRAASSFASGDFEPFFRSSSSSHNLIIRSTETDPKSLAAADEDLNVMGKILSKAASKTGEDDEKTALGVRITSFGSGVRNIQIEGHGAIFLLKANFPLVGPSEKVEEEKPKEPGNSTWEQTRDELYGAHESSGEMRRLGHSKEPKIKYDPERVEQLENTLLDAMKNAANIRALKDGETVTIVVTSGDDGSNIWSVETGPFGYSTGGSGNSYVLTGSNSSHSATSHRSTRGGTLTIRAKKSDIDAFFHGKIDTDGFRRKATIALY